MSDEAAGTLTALLQRAMAHAAGVRAGAAVAPVELHVAFLHDAGAPATAAGRVCGGGKSVLFCEAEAIDAHGLVVARASGTYRVRRHALAPRAHA